MPYDRFVLEQLAGDLLPDEPGRAERLPAPGLPRPRAGLLRRPEGARPDRRPHRHADPRLPRPDGRLRPLPRPQVRPDPDGRLLRPGRRLRQHRVRGGPRRPARAGRGLRRRRRRPSEPRTARSTRSLQGRVGPARRDPRREAARYLVAAWKMKAIAAGLRPRRIAATRSPSRRGSTPTVLERWVAFLDARGEGPGEAQLARGPAGSPAEQVPDGRADEASLPRSSRPPRRSRSTCSTLLARREAPAMPEGRREPADLDAARARPCSTSSSATKGVLAVPKERVEKLLPDESRAGSRTCAPRWSGCRRRPRRATRWCIP